MNQIKTLVQKIVTPAVLALTGLSALAGVPADITPPTVDTSKKATLSTLWGNLATIINYIVALVGVASLIFLMYGAYLYMSSGQNEENLKKAKNSVIYGIIGAIVAILAFSIFKFALSLVGGADAQ